MKQTHHLVLVSGVFARQIFKMNFPRLFPFIFAVSASLCVAQLPPSLVRPGTPVVPVAPVPLVPSPSVPGVPAAPSGLATELPSSSQPNTLTNEEIAVGWKLLFDGKRLIGMRGLQKADPLSSGWKIQDGELNLPKDVKDMERMTGGDLVTLDFFWDFDFRFEFKMTASANSGVRYMLVEIYGQVPVGLEYQIIDNVHNSISLKGGALRRTGALDNIYPAGENAKLRVGDPLNKSGDPWNEGRVVVHGTHVEHWLNGEKVLEYELGPAIRKIAVGNKMPVPATYGMKSRTRLSIVDQGYEVSFRNLKVLPLAPQAVVIPSGAGANPLLVPRAK